MRICYLCADPGITLDGHKGASAHFRGLVRAFSALGHEVLVISSSPSGTVDIGVPVFSIPSPEVLEAVSSNGHPRILRALRHLWNNVTAERVLREVLSDSKPQILYERYSPFSIAGGAIAKRLGVPHVLEVNAPLAWEGKQYRQQALQEAAEVLERIAFDSASLIITVGEVLRNELLAAGVESSKLVVVPCGVDLDTFTPRGNVYCEGLEGKTVIGFVGSLKSWHGLDILAEAFKRLASDPRLHLLIVGDGPMRKLLRSLRDEFPGQVTLVGAVPQAEVPAYVRAMDIAVAPYPQLDFFYFSPLKIFEYMAAGRAIVATGIGQINELIKDGKTGILVPPGNAIALADSIHKLVSEPDLRSALGEEAQKEAVRSHSWMKRASEIIKLAETLT